jgi:paraquat-inducible protein B
LLGWFWVLPGAVLVVVSIVVYLSLAQRGERIFIHFNEGHGLKPGDAVRCRGITVGEVQSVELSPDLKGVDVVIDLRPTAGGIAVKDSRFWIVRPQAALTGVSGLETVVGAKYIAALPGGGSAEHTFVGLEEAPAVELEPPESGGLRIVLEASRMSGLRPGVPLTYHGVRIGSVLKSELADGGGAVDVEVYVLPAHKRLVRENSLFWNVSGFKLSAGLASGLTLTAESAETVLAGGVAMATPGKPGPPVEDGKRFPLADEPPKERGDRIFVHFREGHGLKAGDPLRHRGITLGEVHSVELSPGLQGVDVAIDLRPRAEGVAVDGSRFWIVRPQADLTGVSGLETVVGPRYVAVLPGKGAAQEKFDGVEEAPVPEAPEPGRLEIVLQSKRLGGLRAGVPLTYRQVRIGSVESARLASDASAVEARVCVLPAYAGLVRENSEFWHASGFKVGFGPLSGLTLDAESASTVLAGGVNMATPDKPGKPVENGRRFDLLDKPTDGALVWTPSIPLIDPRLPEGNTVPPLVKATLKYRTPGRVYGTSPEERRGLLLPVDRRLLGPSDLLSVPANAVASQLAFEGVAQPIPHGKETGPLRWLEVTDPSVRDKIKEWLPRDRVREATEKEDCLLVGDSSSGPLLVAAARLKSAKDGWTLDDASLTREQWHGAAAVSRKDGQVMGVLEVPEKGPKRIIPLTKDLLRR